MSAAHVLDALLRLEGMAVAGLLPDDVAREAELIGTQATSKHSFGKPREQPSSDCPGAGRFLIAWASFLNQYVPNRIKRTGGD